MELKNPILIRGKKVRVTKNNKTELVNSLSKYLDALIKHSKIYKSRVIENQFKKEQIIQPDLFCVKEKISWELASKINREIELITNHINKLENE